MSIATEETQIILAQVQAGVPVAVSIPAYGEDDIQVINARTGRVAVRVRDYVVSLDKPYETFEIEFVADYVSELDGDEVIVRRVLDYETSTTPALASRASFTSREFERAVMRDQQLRDMAGSAIRSVRGEIIAPLNFADSMLVGASNGAIEAHIIGTPSERRFKLLGFGSTGMLEAVDPDNPVITVQQTAYSVTPQDFGGTDSDSLKAAVATGRDVYLHKVTSDSSDVQYYLEGELALKPGQKLIGVGKPTLHITTDANERGIWFPPGCDGAEIAGSFNINYTCIDGNPGGDFCSAIVFGQFVYDTASPKPVLNCKVTADISMRLLGPANGNALAVYGYVEDCDVNLPDIAETNTTNDITNFVWPVHWGHDNTADRQGLPTKTWHPHRLVLRSGLVGSGTSIIRALRLSAAGDVVVDGLDVSDVREAVSIFCGDYGYQFAQNISTKFKPHVHFAGICRTRDCTGFHVSIDGQSAGKNGSDIVDVDFIVSGSLDCANTRNGLQGELLSVSHADSVCMSLTGFENDTTKPDQSVALLGVRKCVLDLDLLAPNAVIVRACGDVVLNGVVKHVAHPKRAPAGDYGVSASSVTGAATVVGAVTRNARTITITNPGIVTGDGGFIKYDNGTTVYELELASSTNTADGQQTLDIIPSPVAIPDGANVTVVQTVKSLRLDALIAGWQVGVRTTGADRIRSLDVSGSRFLDNGVFDVDFGEVENFVAIGTYSDGGGYGNANAYGLRANNTTGYVIANVQFGSRSEFRFDVYCDNDSNGGVVNGVVSLNSICDAVVFYDSTGGASNVKVGNIVSTTGRTEVSPN